MKRLKHDFKKGMVFVLSFAMAAGLIPVMSDGANTVQAATGSGTGNAPSVSAYAAKEQMMDSTFAPNASGEATNYGKLVFGKNSSEDAQEWYILGKDDGVSGENTILFATSPIATNQQFNSSKTDDKTYNYEAGTGYGDTAGNTTVYANHYGASDFRAVLQDMAANENYFTTAEQGLMNDTTVTTKDLKNSSVTYTTTDKLYALAADGYGSSYTAIKAGSGDSTVLAMNRYWKTGGKFWLRQAGVTSSRHSNALLASSGSYVSYDGANNENAVWPASNLNLSSVLFASAATAASSDTVSGTIASDAAMTLRFDGTGKHVGAVIYSTTTGNIKATKGSIEGDVALIVQGNDGTKDWYYSKKVTETETVNTSDIIAALRLTSDIDLSLCKIWVEITDTDGLIYAAEAEKEYEKINTAYVTKEQLMNSFKPYSDGTATNYGKLVFGKNSSKEAQEWYILGKDDGVSGDNTIIFAASAIVKDQKFDSGKYFKTYNYEAGTGYGDTAGNISVYVNHYGASELRAALQKLAADGDYFTVAEQGMMNDTTVTTQDIYNSKETNSSVTYTTTDKLYALAADGEGSSYTVIKAGSDDSTVLAMNSYWKGDWQTGDYFWLRSPYLEAKHGALVAWPGSVAVGYGSVYNTEYDVRPASNLNLSSVLFASAATAASSNTVSGTIASDTAMTLRLDGTGKNIGTALYETKTGDIKATKGSTEGDVALIVQGNDGTKDWYYSKLITGTEVVNVKAIEEETDTPASIDLSTCNIWLETTDTDDRMTYAVNAVETKDMNCLHNGEKEVRDAKTATCTQKGYTGDTYCKDCGVLSETGTETEMIPHTYVNGVCSVCDDIFETTVDGVTYQVMMETGAGGKPVGKLVTISGNDVPQVAVAVTGTGDDFAEKNPDGKVTVQSKMTGSGSEQTFVVTEISENAFRGASVTEIVVPATVTEVGTGAFGGATTITFKGTTAPSGIAGAISEAVTTVNVPEGAGDSYKAVLGESVTVVEIHIHTFGDWVTVTEAIEDAEGVKERSCSCGYKETAKIEKLAHTTHVKGTGTRVEPTCEGKGSITYKCTKCGKVMEVAELAALGHKWDAGKVTKKATETQEGVKTYTCSVCGKTKTAAIPKTAAPPKKGDVVSDDKASAKFEVTDVKKKEVAYKAPANKKAKTVTIPATVKIGGVTYKVTKIADNAFKNNKTVTKVTIGSNIKAIGKNAFYKCTKLKTVSVGKNVTEIGANAFYGCSSLTSVTLPGKTTRIGANTFNGCKKLKTIKITSTKLTSKTVAKSAFKGLTKATTIKVPKKKLTPYKKLFKSKGLSSKVKVKGY